MTVKIKICGLTNIEDALAAHRLGADALGFVLAESPRKVGAETVREIVNGLPPLAVTVGVFVNTPVKEIIRIRDYCGLDILQLHGEVNEKDLENLGRRVIKVVKMGGPDKAGLNGYPKAMLLLDTYSPDRAGGTGRTFDWNEAVDIARQRPVILAGGLKPENAASAVNIVKPYAVDVSSGVEKEPGRKDHAKIEHFINRAKSVL